MCLDRNSLGQAGTSQLKKKEQASINKKRQNILLSNQLPASIFTDLFSSNVSVSARRLCSAISFQ